MEEQKEYTCKARLRSELIERRKSIADKPMLSKEATARVLPMLRGSVMVYVSMPNELSTKALIEALLLREDVRVYVPHTVGEVITPKRLCRLGAPDKLGNIDENRYVQSEQSVHIDMCVTPLIGFNADGYRIGYGKGCYDRFFAQNDAYKIGLAFDAQRAEFSPEPHDIPLDCCVTESGVIYFNRNASNIG